MSISIGQSVLVPDNLTIEQNGGNIRLKAGTQGDLWVAGADGTFSRLAIGANGTVLTSNGTSATWGASSGGEGWEHITTKNFIGYTAVSIGPFTTAEEMLLIVKVKSNTTGTLIMIFNNDWTNAYDYISISSSGIGEATGQGHLRCSRADANEYLFYRMYISGTAPAYGGFVPPRNGTSSGITLGFKYVGANPITFITLTSLAGNYSLTGKMELYGRSQHA